MAIYYQYSALPQESLHETFSTTWLYVTHTVTPADAMGCQSDGQTPRVLDGEDEHLW
jgi:hypothetical protein